MAPPSVCLESLEPSTVGCESLANTATEALILLNESSWEDSVYMDPFIFSLSALNPASFGFDTPTMGLVPDLLITPPGLAESRELDVLDILSLY